MKVSLYWCHQLIFWSIFLQWRCSMRPASRRNCRSMWAEAMICSLGTRWATKLTLDSSIPYSSSPTIIRKLQKMADISFQMECRIARFLLALFQQMCGHIVERNPTQRSSRLRQLFLQDTKVLLSTLLSQLQPLTTTLKNQLLNQTWVSLMQLPHVRHMSSQLTFSQSTIFFQILLQEPLNLTKTKTGAISSPNSEPILFLMPQWEEEPLRKSHMISKLFPSLILSILTFLLPPKPALLSFSWMLALTGASTPKR